MRLLGIDYGSKRVGIALSDESGRFAFPHSVLKNDKNLVKIIADICSNEKVEKIILGESLNYKGELNDIAKDAQIFKVELEQTSGLPVVYENEFMSSAEAERLQGKGDKLDASAAAIILRSYIDKTH